MRLFSFLSANVLLMSVYAHSAVFNPDRASAILNSTSSSNLAAITNLITVSFWHTVVSNVGGDYISRNTRPFRVKTSGVAPQQFDFLYVDVSGASHQWRTTSESYNVQGYNFTACTFHYGDGTSFRLYTNGVSQAGSWIGGDGNNAATNVGGQITQLWGNGGSAGGQEGYYSEVAIWQAALSNDEINLIRRSKLKGIQRQVRPSALRMYLSLDGWPDSKDVSTAPATPFTDSVVHGNNTFMQPVAPTVTRSVAERVCSYYPNE